MQRNAVEWTFRYRNYCLYTQMTERTYETNVCFSFLSSFPDISDHTSLRWFEEEIVKIRWLFENEDVDNINPKRMDICS